MNDYERSVFALCSSCNSIQELPLDESEPIRITGKPKLIAEGNCKKCNSKIEIYALMSVYQS